MVFSLVEEMSSDNVVPVWSQSVPLYRKLTQFNLNLVLLNPLLTCDHPHILNISIKRHP